MAKNQKIKELEQKLRKLKPQDKIRRLKELEEQRKEEISEIGDLIKDSERELKTEAVAEEIIPEQTEINIARLFEEQAVHLEATVIRESPPTARETHEYLSFKQAYGDYSRLKDIAYAGLMGAITPAQLDTVDRIGEKLDRTKYQSQSQEIANILVASRATLYKIWKYAGWE